MIGRSRFYFLNLYSYLIDLDGVAFDFLYKLWLLFAYGIFNLLSKTFDRRHLNNSLVEQLVDLVVIEPVEA